MVLAGMKRTKGLLAALCFAIPLNASAVVPYDIGAKFHDAGCRIVRSEQVARTELDAQRVFVAWCSGMEVYLMVIKCEGRLCRVIE
jgi:hypothetical protein